MSVMVRHQVSLTNDVEEECKRINQALYVARYVVAVLNFGRPDPTTERTPVWERICSMVATQ